MDTIIIPLLTFALISCITPGPNNMMLTASGANFGFKQTVPHILGVTSGLIGLMIVAALGLGALFMGIPRLQSILKVMGAGYLFYLAWKIATAKPSGSHASTQKPFSFIQAAAFQFLNPKALMMTVTAMSTFTLTGDLYLSSTILVTSVFAVICIPSISIWAGFGTVLGRLLKNNRVFRLFNLTMGGLTAGTVILII